MLSGVGEGFARYLSRRRSRKDDEHKERLAKQRQRKTGAEEQRELERMGMIKRLAEVRLMALEDARSMAVERVERAKRVLKADHARHVRAKAWERRIAAEKRRVGQRGWISLSV